jgi:hypothetical protein
LKVNHIDISASVALENGQGSVKIGGVVGNLQSGRADGTAESGAAIAGKAFTSARLRLERRGKSQQPARCE